ncbi:hypothetical protein MMC26_005804 [Xylographa opegraphella]|nr:hypothetical protein [Xylographa opegraphella]
MPPPLEITVTGASVISRPAERAVLSLTVMSEGPSQSTVSHDVTSTSHDLRATFQALSPKTATGDAAPDAAITVFSTTALTTKTWVPDDRHGDPLPARLYAASTRFHVIFRAFATLAEVAGALFATPHVVIESTKWTLTDATLAAVASESRRAAMRDAVTKAADLADVVGRRVVAVQIEDLGSVTMGRTRQTARMGGPPSGASGIGVLALEPEDVEVNASVKVKFVGE